MKKTHLLAKIMSLVMVVQSISTTSLVAFANEDVNINADETIFTSNNNDEYISYFDAVVSVSVQETGENLEGVDVKFVEYSEDTELNPDAEKIAELDSWNTSDSNPHTIENIGFTEGHFYCVEIEQLPDGYSVGGRSYISSGYHGSAVFSGTMPYDITPEHKSPLAELDFPVESAWNATFSIKDIVDEELFSDLDIELVSMDSDCNVQCVLAEWNTSENIVYSIELPYYFENEYSASYYGVKIKNLPEGYVYNNTDSKEASYNGYSVFSYSALDLRLEMREPELSEDLHDYVVYLREENAIVENTTRPHTTTTTTASEDDITTTTTASEDNTTTTTTASKDDITTTTTASKDDTTTTTTTNTEDLPQAGMPFARIIEGMSLMLVVSGTMLVVKSKRNED